MDDKMKQHNIVQGSPEWITYRGEHYNASDAPAMLGISPYKTRTQLLDETATGITPEVYPATQRRFDEGHRFEALARPLAEEIIDRTLYPVVASLGKLSASFDGLTSDNSICWEHKTLNSGIRKTMGISGDASLLEEHYRAQMEQQLIVSGADECLFMASTWDKDALLEITHGWYVSDQSMRLRILQGWEQFSIDLKTHQAKTIIERPQARVSTELPALFIHAQGTIINSNMEEFGRALTAKLSEVRAIKLDTDQDFSNAKEAAKLFREQAKKLKLAKESMLEQTITIGEASRMIDAWAEDLNKTALQLEKDVEKEDLAKKRLIVSEATIAYSAYVAALEIEIPPIRLNVTNPDFAAALKGKRTYASMQSAVDDALANGKIVADAVLREIRKKLVIYSGTKALGYEFLFHDLQTIIAKPEEDFELIIQTRVKNYVSEINAKREAEREAKSERIKAEARTNITEERAKAEIELKTPPAKVNRPTREQMAETIAVAYNVTISTALKWLMNEFSERKELQNE